MMGIVARVMNMKITVIIVMNTNWGTLTIDKVSYREVGFMIKPDWGSCRFESLIFNLNWIVWIYTKGSHTQEVYQKRKKENLRTTRCVYILGYISSVFNGRHEWRCLFTDIYWWLTRLAVTFLMKNKTQSMFNNERYITWMKKWGYSIQTIRTD